MCSLPCNPEALASFISEPDSTVCAALEDIGGDILVLGAGGKIGPHLSLCLSRAMRRLGKPQQVIAVSRFGSPAAREEFASYGIPIWKADLSVQEEVETLPDAALVFFLAGAKFGTAGAPELLRQANIEAPRLVAERFGSVPVVALSTGCVYPFTRIDSGGSRESDPVCPPCGYAQSCVGREEAFATVSRRDGMPCAIIRLNYSV